MLLNALFKHLRKSNSRSVGRIARLGLYLGIAADGR